MKWIDLPPVWLFVCLLATYWIGRFQPDVASIGGAVSELAGGLLVVLGLGLMALAIFEMGRHKTTIIPHLNATHLVRTGIFARSRNPIYLGDMFVLAGMILWWDALLAAPLLYLLYVVLLRRFILPEEARLRRGFGAAFDDYLRETGRWMS